MKKLLTTIILLCFSVAVAAQDQEDFWEDSLSDYEFQSAERLDALVTVGDQLDLLIRLQTYMQMQDGDCDPVIEIDDEARAGDPSQQWFLSTLYSEGLCLPQNEEQAFVWAERAAQQGLSGAQLDIAFWLSTGTGTTLDMEASISWAERASEGSEKYRANLFLGGIFEKGTNVVPNSLRAESYYLKAFDTEHIDAASVCVPLGRLQSDIYGDADLKTIETYRKGASRGSYICQALLSVTIASSGDVNDQTEALKWAYISLASDQIEDNPAFKEAIEDHRDNVINLLLIILIPLIAK